MRIFLLSICLLLSACQPAERTDIRFAVAQMPLNLDPRYATDAASERVNRLLYQPLVDFDAASKPAWVLASGDAISDTEYRFTLQKNAQFHHGKPLTSADVKATYASLMRLKDAPHAADFAHVASIETPDEKTVIFHLKQADKHFPSKLIIGILPQDLIDKGHDFSHRPVGSGALRFVSWQHDLQLKRLSDNQVITLQEVKDPTVRVLKLQRGEVDLLQGDLPPELVKHLQGTSLGRKPIARIQTGSGANYSYLGLNMQDPVLQNLKVRQALAHAIDRKAIIRKVMIDGTREAGAILPPEHYTNQTASGNGDLAPYDYNPQLARQLLQEAGVQLPLKLLYKTSTDAFRVRLATIMQAQMRQAGIELQIKSLDWGTFFADVKAGNFQLFGLTWVGIKTPEIYAKAFGSNFMPPAGFNRGRYTDAELDALLAKEDWPAATRRIHAQLPYIPLWYEGQFTAMRRDVQGFGPKPDGNWDDLATIKRSATINENAH